MITLVATDAEDGWAVARDADQWWQIVPPYQRADRRPIADDIATRIILDQALTVVDRSFADWGELCRFVQQARVTAAQQRGHELRSSWAEVLRFTTTRRATIHLDHLAAKIESRDLQGVQDGIVALLKAPAVRADPATLERAIELLARVTQVTSTVAPRRTSWATTGVRPRQPALLFG